MEIYFIASEIETKAVQPKRFGLVCNVVEIIFPACFPVIIINPSRYAVGLISQEEPRRRLHSGGGELLYMGLTGNIAIIHNPRERKPKVILF